MTREVAGSWSRDAEQDEFPPHGRHSDTGTPLLAHAGRGEPEGRFGFSAIGRVSSSRPDSFTPGPGNKVFSMAIQGDGIWNERIRACIRAMLPVNFAWMESFGYASLCCGFIRELAYVETSFVFPNGHVHHPVAEGFTLHWPRTARAKCPISSGRLGQKQRRSPMATLPMFFHLLSVMSTKRSPNKISFFMLVSPKLKPTPVRLLLGFETGVPVLEPPDRLLPPTHQRIIAGSH